MGGQTVCPWTESDMKIVLITVVGLLVGVVAGAGVGGSRVKGEILHAREQAAADSAAAARHDAESDHQEPGAEVLNAESLHRSGGPLNLRS